MSTPCKDCAERDVGCHSACTRYVEYKMQVDASREDRRRQKESCAYFYDKEKKVHQLRVQYEKRMKKIHR